MKHGWSRTGEVSRFSILRSTFCILTSVFFLTITAFAGQPQTDPPPEPGPLAAIEQMSRLMLQAGGATRQTLEASCKTLVYWTVGTGPAVVLIHGANDQAGLWSRGVLPLRENYRFIIPDLPGHGESDPATGPLDLGMMVRAVEALIAAESPDESVILVGNSMGGWIALLYALEHPDRVSQVVLENSGGLTLDYEGPTLLPTTREEARALFEAGFGGELSFPDAILDDFIRRAPTSPAARLAERSWNDYFLDDRLGSLAVPVTLLWGEKDDILPLDYAKRMASLIPGAKLATIAGCGHIPHNECPGEFSALLRRVLSEADVSR